MPDNHMQRADVQDRSPANALAYTDPDSTDAGAHSEDQSDVPVWKFANTAAGSSTALGPGGTTSSSHHQHTSNQASEVLVISGGSGFNDLVGATPGATFVMPISDNGGSSSEIIRVLGGPSIGDLRSRLNRLIPLPSRPGNDFRLDSYTPPPSNEAIHNLLSYRLPSNGKSREIKQEWMDILEGRHRFWRGIEPERKEVIRGFLVYFESEVLRRAHRHFNFRGGSIGNFFLAAAQKFFRSIQSAIFLFSATTQINASQLGSKVLPVINTNHTATIAAELEDGEIIVGQCEISHPAPQPLSAQRNTASGDFQHGQAGESRNTPSLGTPSTAIPGEQPPRSFSIHAQDPALLTPAFGPPAHYLGQESTSYDFGTNSGYLARLQSQTPKSTGEMSPAVDTVLLQKAVTSSNLSFAKLVEEKASGPRKGLTTVGNTKDGLEPDEDDQDSQDGADDPELDDALGTAASRMDAADTPERTGNIVFQKQGIEDGSEESLPSKIARICYVNAYRNEIYPAPNPAFVSSLLRSKTLIYSCGSLWTSIMPCLCLRGIATSIAKSTSLQHKVLLLNTVQDRETMGMNALDFVQAITTSLNRSDFPNSDRTVDYSASAFITHLVYFPEGQVEVDVPELQAMGIECIVATSALRSRSGFPKFDEEALRRALEQVNHT